MFARPGVVGAASNFIYPAQLRALGAKTVYWEMNLRQRVGTPTNPIDPGIVQDWADRVFYRAVASSGCATPWIALNEMWGSNLATPWSPTNTQYRDNVLQFVRRLSALGAHPFLLLNSRPFTDGEAGDWWRQVALYTNFVREVYFAAPQVYRQGPVLGSRNLRNAFRQGVTDLTSIGIPASKIGIFLGFHTNPGQGGREHLKPASAWFDTIKWQVLAIEQVSREIPLATVWSWGWGEWAAADRDPDKPAAACVYLWTRNHSLCSGPKMAGRKFDTSLTEGQLILPAGSQCTTPWGLLGSSQLSSVAHVTGDREIAYTSLFGRLVLKNAVQVKPQDLHAAERAIIRYRFGGSGAAYRGALARAGASTAIARGVISDELRQARIERNFRVKAPAGKAISSYRESYASTPGPPRPGPARPGLARAPQPRGRNRRPGARPRLQDLRPRLVEGEDPRRCPPRARAEPDGAVGGLLAQRLVVVDPRRPRAGRSGLGLRQLAHAPRVGRSAVDDVPEGLVAGRWARWSSRPSCRSSRWLPEDDEILLTAADGAAAGRVLEQLEVGREASANVRLGVKGRAQVRARDAWPAHDGLAGVVLRTLDGVEPVGIRVAVRGQEEQAAGSGDPAQLVDPGPLEVVRQVGENRDRVDEPEPPVLVSKRRSELVDRRRDEREVRRAPAHESLVVVAAVDLSPVDPGPVPKDAPATAPEVEQ